MTIKTNLAYIYSSCAGNYNHTPPVERLLARQLSMVLLQIFICMFVDKTMYVAVVLNVFEVEKHSNKEEVSMEPTITEFEPVQLRTQKWTYCIFLNKETKRGGLQYHFD